MWLGVVKMQDNIVVEVNNPKFKEFLFKLGIINSFVFQSYNKEKFIEKIITNIEYIENFLNKHSQYKYSDIVTIENRKGKKITFSLFEGKIYNEEFSLDIEKESLKELLLFLLK